MVFSSAIFITKIMRVIVALNALLVADESAIFAIIIIMYQSRFIKDEQQYFVQKSINSHVYFTLEHIPSDRGNVCTACARAHSSIVWV